MGLKGKLEDRLYEVCINNYIEKYKVKSKLSKKLERLLNLIKEFGKEIIRWLE